MIRNDVVYVSMPDMIGATLWFVVTCHFHLVSVFLFRWELHLYRRRKMRLDQYGE